MIYAGKELSDYDLWALGIILGSLHAAEKRREQASKHPKFDKFNNQKAMEFPPPNPAFLNLKSEVEKEIKRKQGV